MDMRASEPFDTTPEDQGREADGEIDAAERRRSQASAREALARAISEPVSIAWCDASDPPPEALLYDGPGTEKPVGLYRGEVAVLVGAGGSGKSFLALRVALAATGRPDRRAVTVSDGDPLTMLPGRVLVVSAEDSRGAIARRLRQLWPALECDGLHVVDVSESDARLLTMDRVNMEGDYGRGSRVTRTFMEPTRFMLKLRDELARLRDEGQGFDLVILDPLARLAPHEAETDNAAAAQLLATLQGFARAAGAAVLVTHHTTKNARLSETDDGAATAARGASALVDGARTVINLGYGEKDKGDAPLLLSVSKASHHARWNNGRGRRVCALAGNMKNDRAPAASGKEEPSDENWMAQSLRRR